MRYFLLLSIGMLALALNAKGQSFNVSADDFDYVPGDLIVKFKEASPIAPNINGSGVIQSLDSVSIIRALGLQDTPLSIDFVYDRELSRSSGLSSGPRVVDGFDINPTVKIHFDDERDIISLAKDLSQNPLVEYAEPNFIVTINELEPLTEVLTEAEAAAWMKTNTTAEARRFGEVPNDPLFSGQTNVTLTNIDEVWTQSTGNGNTVIAILDTGVDNDHPDLADNMWTNTAELNGVAGVDDDNNGFVDDIHGWDFINEDNDPKDDNSHGTHVAGIAAAVGNNGIGLAGAVWDAQIMSIKVFQSSGRGDAATIARGIEYASKNGAHILNMSFGTYAESITMKDALEEAYTTSILVGSAGNDNRCIGPGAGCAPLFPGAYTFVLGIQDGPDAVLSYSNFDSDGPVFSKYRELLNYEIIAPGSNIMSTVPGGGYRAYTGTSMSAPLVAGAMALYQEIRPGDSQELIFGNLINTAATYFDLQQALGATPQPDLKMITADLIDTLNTGTSDGQADIGEIIQIKPTVKNYWGPTDSVFVAIDFAEFEDRSKATLMDSIKLIGSVSAYGVLASNDSALSLKISPDLNNDVDISFKLLTWSKKDKANAHSIDYVINVKNAIKFSGLITSDITLTADKKYLVSDQLVIGGNAILTIKPGATLEIGNDVNITVNDQAEIHAIGKKDSLINIKAEGSRWGKFNFGGSAKVFFDYVVMSGFWGDFVNEVSPSKVTNTVFVDNKARNASLLVNAPYFEYNNIIENDFFGTAALAARSGVNVEHNNVINNFANSEYHTQGGFIVYPWYGLTDEDTIGNVFNNYHSTSLANVNGSYGSSTVDMPPLYLGATDSLTARKGVNDFFNSDFGSIIMAPVDITGFLKEPDSLAHGIVWKVLVNGKDAQDEFDELDALGVGTHRFDVYFNRTMDTNFTPQVSMGVREPFNQEIFTEAGTWSTNGRIYTIFHEVGLSSSDGINRIRVQDARDPYLFEVPVESSRFNVLVQAAGSASIGFNATAGIGKVDLDWVEPSTLLDDILGFNVFRYQINADNSSTDTTQVNTTPVELSEFTDYNVDPGTRYYYYYTTVRTNFTETDRSRVVSTVPMTAELGDANGDTNVNILDVTHTVSHILGSPANPFLFYAADVNNDESINVIDVVGIVNLSLSASTGNHTTDPRNIQYLSNIPVGAVDLVWESDTLFAFSPVAIGGFQLQLGASANYEWSAEMSGFDRMMYQRQDTVNLLAFSMSNNTLPAGKTALLTTASPTTLQGAVFSSAQGETLSVRMDSNVLPGLQAEPAIDRIKLGQSFPNPTNSEALIPYWLPENVDQVGLVLVNTQGVPISSFDNLNNSAGRHDLQLSLSQLPAGMYFYSLIVKRGGYLLSKQTKRLIKQ